MIALNEHERITLLMMVGYGDRRRSLQETCDLFNNTFPNRNPISKSTVSKIVHKFEQSGSVKNLPRSGRPKVATNDDAALDVLLTVQEQPTTSTSNIAMELGMSATSVRRILKRNGFHPYKVTLLQELSEDDADRRMQFCQEMMDRIEEQPDLIDKILFSDEATFHMNGVVNRHNCRYWSNENPHWMEQDHTQYPQKLNVWAGIIGSRIIGPFIIHENLTGDIYLNLLRHSVLPQLINLFPNPANPQLLRNDIYFQQDGAPPHYARNVRFYLDETFPNRWIGRRGRIEWPARSPDLTPLDFFFWGYVKSVVYKTKPNTLAELEERIRDVAGRITPQSLQNVQRGFIDRLGYCQAAEGLHFEHLIK